MNDAQRKAMEDAIAAFGRLRNPKTIFDSTDCVVAALRAQLDAPAEKGEPAMWAWRAKCPTTGKAIGPFFQCTEEGAKRAGDCGYEVRAYAAPPTAAQIADEAIEKCAKVCEEAAKTHLDDGPYIVAAYSAKDCATAIRALKSSATPTEGENNGSR